MPNELYSRGMNDGLSENNVRTYGPRREKTCLGGVRQSDIQIGVLSYRD